MTKWRTNWTKCTKKLLLKPFSLNSEIIKPNYFWWLVNCFLCHKSHHQRILVTHRVDWKKITFKLRFLQGVSTSFGQYFDNFCLILSHFCLIFCPYLSHFCLILSHFVPFLIIFRLFLKRNPELVGSPCIYF